MARAFWCWADGIMTAQCHVEGHLVTRVWRVLAQGAQRQEVMIVWNIPSFGIHFQMKRLMWI